MYNYFTNKIEAFDVEMGNSSSELIDYFLKRSQRGTLPTSSGKSERVKQSGFPAIENRGEPETAPRKYSRLSREKQQWRWISI